MAGKDLISTERPLRDATEALIFVGSFRPHVSASVKSCSLRRLLNVSEVEQVQTSVGRALQRFGPVTLRAPSPNAQRW